MTYNMITDTYRKYHADLITHWTQSLLSHEIFQTTAPDQRKEADHLTEEQRLPETTEQKNQTDYAKQLKTLAELPGGTQERELGQWLITTCIARYPHWVPMIPRDLFWYFGGDCMHFLGDEEIEQFQKLDELTAQCEPDTDYNSLRSQTLGLH